MQIPAAARRAVLALLSRQLTSSSDLVYVNLARLGATLGVLGNRRMREVATDAIAALGYSAAPGVVRRFAWNWWYQRSVDELIAFQADRLTPR